jgi:hypothetical protein
MLEDHLHSQVTRHRLRSGLLAVYIDDFADWLSEQQYTTLPGQTG